MKNYTALLLLLLFSLTASAQSYELDYKSFQQMRIAEWTSNTLPNMTMEYDKRGFNFEPKKVYIYNRSELVYTMGSAKVHRILENRNEETIAIFKPFTFILVNGARYRRRITKPGKLLELYNREEELIAKAYILKRSKLNKILKVEIVKPTIDNQALLTLMAIDLLEYFRIEYNPIY